jgi:hypothetical protein
MVNTKEKVDFKAKAITEMRMYGITETTHHDEWFRRFNYKEVYDVFLRTNIDNLKSRQRLEDGSAGHTIKQVLSLAKPECEGQVKNAISLLHSHPRTEIEFYKALLFFVEENANLFNAGEKLESYKRTWR